MVEIINKTIFNGIAGPRGGNPLGVVIHNDAGAMTARAYVPWLQDRYNYGMSAKGFA